MAEMRRVLRPGGRLLVLGVSQVWKPLAPFYDFYSFQVIPRVGKLVTNDSDSYRYLSESIRMHPGRERAETMMEGLAGEGRVLQHGDGRGCPASRLNSDQAMMDAPTTRRAGLNHLLARNLTGRVERLSRHAGRRFGVFQPACWTPASSIDAGYAVRSVILIRSGEPDVHADPALDILVRALCRSQQQLFPSVTWGRFGGCSAETLPSFSVISNGMPRLTWRQQSSAIFPHRLVKSVRSLAKAGQGARLSRSNIRRICG